MLEFFKQYAWIGVVLAALAAFWRQVVWAWQYVMHLFVGSIRLTENNQRYIQAYLEKKGKVYYRGPSFFLRDSHQYDPSLRKMRLVMDFMRIHSEFFGRVDGWLIYIRTGRKDSPELWYIKRRRKRVGRLLMAVRDWLEREQMATQRRFRIVDTSVSDSDDPAKPTASPGNNQPGPASISFSTAENPALAYFPLDDKFLISQDVYTPAFQFRASVLGQKIIDRALWWYEHRQWYLARQIPWRRGMLLGGPPGSGKTMLVTMVAQKLDLPLFIVDAGCTEETFVKRWRTACSEAPAIILLDDLERQLTKHDDVKGPDTSSYDYRHRLRPERLLQLMSGPEVSEGLLIFATVNDLTKLDTAFGVPTQVAAESTSTRPGRFDEVFIFGAADEGFRRDRAECILKDYRPGARDRLVLVGANDTIAQFVERCLQYVRDNPQPDV